MKKLIIALMFLFCVGGFFVHEIESQASTEVQNEENVENEEKEEKKSILFVEDGKTYYADENGKLVKNQFLKVGKNTYYFGKTGAALTGWQTIKKNKYYFDKTGVMQTGKEKIGKRYYFFNKEGVLWMDGWKTIDGKKHYFSEKNGAAITGWKEFKHKKYYFDDEGVMQTGFTKVGKYNYYFDSKGIMCTGWLKKGGSYYYLDRANGKRTEKGKVNGITIKKGKAYMTAANKKYNKSKIEMMIKARGIVEDNTSVTDSKSQKLEKMFKWVMKGSYKRYRILPVARQKKGWEMTFANDHFKNRKGCCVSDACAFAFLATECGYKAYVADDTSHAWTEINGRVYDPLFAQSKSYDTYYGGTYKEAKVYKHNRLGI